MHPKLRSRTMKQTSYRNGTRAKSRRRERIDRLKAEAERLGGPALESYESDDCPEEILEQFWQRIVAFENAPRTTLYKKLESSGTDLPGPESLDEKTVSAKLWEVVTALSRMRVFLENTDHLSDRQLYRTLWEECLREEHIDIDLAEGACHVDLLGSGTDEDLHLYLKYYADESFRSEWAEDSPETEMPRRTSPPFDRDRHLPRPDSKAGHLN